MAFQKAGFFYIYFGPCSLSLRLVHVNIFNYKRNLNVCTMAYAFFLFVGWSEFDESAQIVLLNEVIKINQI